MVLLNMYGKISPTTISNKLGISVCNPDDGWTKGFLDDFEEEIMLFNHQTEAFRRDGLDVSSLAGRLDLERIVNQSGWAENGKSAPQVLAEHLIEIQISDYENSMLQVKNQYMYSPTCEPQYERKFLNFCSRVQSAETASKIIPGQIPFSTYNSDDFNVKPSILNYLASSLCMDDKTGVSHRDYTDKGITSLRHIGRLIDSLLSSEKEFWLLDYVVNAIFYESNSNAYNIFKTMSLIEMLIIDPINDGKTKGEMEKKLPQFLPGSIPTEKAQLFASIVRKLRNKIAHGDFEAIQKLLAQYREAFMEDCWLDEYECSIETWVYDHICITLDKALNEILWLMLSDRNKLIKLQKS